MTHLPPKLRSLLTRVLDRPIAASEPVHETLDDLEEYLDERDRAGALPVVRFFDAPELVVQVHNNLGERTRVRLAGGEGSPEDRLDATQRAFARALLGLALDYLNDTEPTSASAAHHKRPPQ